MYVDCVHMLRRTRGLFAGTLAFYLYYDTGNVFHIVFIQNMVLIVQTHERWLIVLWLHFVSAFILKHGRNWDSLFIMCFLDAL